MLNRRAFSRSLLALPLSAAVLRPGWINSGKTTKSDDLPFIEHGYGLGDDRLDWLRRTVKTYHDAVRWKLHNVQLTGREVVPSGAGRMWWTIPLPVAEDKNTIEYAASNIARHIHAYGPRVETAWYNFDSKINPVWYQASYGLRLSAQLESARILFSTMLKGCTLPC